MTHERYPLVFQLNTRLRLRELSLELGRPASLRDIPDRDLEQLAEQGFDYLYLLGVWRTGQASRAVSRSRLDWRDEYRRALPDLEEEDICGSCFAVTGYEVPEEHGGSEALHALRERSQKRGLGLILDFVGNHTALDHPWVFRHPDYFVRGRPADLEREPENYVDLSAAGHPAAGEMPAIFAYGRDPYFPGWPDTLQLNYAEPAVHEAMKSELLRAAGQCDGLRCDMAMLLLPNVFERTWGLPAVPFWPDAIARVRSVRPDFLFMAEVYWDLEWTLQQQGFDFTYDKRLYDRLREGRAIPVRQHLQASPDYQGRLVRFMENHDEPRAAATFSPETHQAAAVLTYLTPGVRFFHQGQFEGRRTRVSMHLNRAPEEPVDETVQKFYQGLLPLVARDLMHSGEWVLLECRPAWEGNSTADDFIAFVWHTAPGLGAGSMLIVVNYSAHQSQCYVPLEIEPLGPPIMRLRDGLGRAVYDREAEKLRDPGLYLDLPPWGYHAFQLTST